MAKGTQGTAAKSKTKAGAKTKPKVTAKAGAKATTSVTGAAKVAAKPNPKQAAVKASGAMKAAPKAGAEKAGPSKAPSTPTAKAGSGTAKTPKAASRQIAEAPAVNPAEVALKAIAKAPGKSAAAPTTAVVDAKAEVAPSTLAMKSEKGEKAEKKAAGSAKAEKKSKKSAKALAIALDKLADLGAQWNALYERSKDLEVVPYKMSDSYEARTAIMHKVLGWGYVLSTQNDRLEVLFKDGIKILISNYKG